MSRKDYNIEQRMRGEDNQLYREGPMEDEVEVMEYRDLWINKDNDTEHKTDLENDAESKTKTETEAIKVIVNKASSDRVKMEEEAVETSHDNYENWEKNLCIDMLE